MKGPLDPRRGRNCTRRSPLGGAFIGLFIILVGTALLFENLGIFRVRDIWDYAPLLLVGFGILRIVESSGRTSPIIFGGVLVAAGTLWTLDNLGIVSFNPSLIPPVLLIAWGAMLLVRTLERQQRLAGSDPLPASSGNVTSQYAIFSGSKKICTSPEYAGGEAIAIFGGVELDLRQAQLAPGQVILDVNAIFGGVEIHVPPTWNIIQQGSAIFGGWEDKTLHPGVPNPPELIISGSAIFGGVSVLN